MIRAALFPFSVVSLITFSTSISIAQEEVVNGMHNDECVFPSAVYIGGCTATLVSPNAITTAQHCSPGPGTTVTFGEENAPTRNPVTVSQCVTGSSEDGAICSLSEPVYDVPTTPILFGCELDKYLVEDEPAWITGYGNIADTTPTDAKRWAEVHIAEVHPGHTVIGLPVNGSSTTPSPCRGDSGGPVYIRTDDGSYRLFGTTFRGTTGIPCNGAANFQRVDTIVAQFEATTGVDVTPCFDGATGDWEPSADCGGFYADEPGLSSGTWANMCSDAAVSGASTECGDADPGSGTGGSGTGGVDPGTGGMDPGAGGTTGAGGSPVGSGGVSTGGLPGVGDDPLPVDGTGGDGEELTGEMTGDDYDSEVTGDEPGCACGVVGHTRTGRYGWLGLLLLTGLVRRRRPQVLQD